MKTLTIALGNRITVVLLAVTVTDVSGFEKANELPEALNLERLTMQFDIVSSIAFSTSL